MHRSCLPAADRLKCDAGRHHTSVWACVWGTVRSGKQSRGTAHPNKPLAEHRAICFWKCQDKNHYRNGKLLLIPITLLSLFFNVWICSIIKAETKLRKDWKDGLGCCHREKMLLYLTSHSPWYRNVLSKVMKTVLFLNICKVRSSKWFLFLFIRYSPNTYFST